MNKISVYFVTIHTFYPANPIKIHPLQNKNCEHLLNSNTLIIPVSCSIAHAETVNNSNLTNSFMISIFYCSVKIRMREGGFTSFLSTRDSRLQNRGTQPSSMTLCIRTVSPHRTSSHITDNISLCGGGGEGSASRQGPTRPLSPVREPLL